MKISSWNVNGIRSALKTTFLDWVRSSNSDIICLQEIKADASELPEELTAIEGYHSYFNSASSKKGYSGVAIYTKIKPLSVETKLGIPRFDDEGRCLKLTFKDFTLFNFYIPNGGRMKENMAYKFDVYKNLFQLLKLYVDQETILVGDFNIAHQEIDLFYPKQNKNNTMFTPEERKQLDTLISLGYVDSFRKLYPEKKSYTWWPYMRDLREKDIGWRIDYIFVSKSLENKLQDAFSEREVLGSDHGPFSVILDKKVVLESVVHSKKEAQSAIF